MSEETKAADESGNVPVSAEASSTEAPPVADEAPRKQTPEEKAAKVKAAAEAREARMRAKAEAEKTASAEGEGGNSGNPAGEEAGAEPEKPTSPNQPFLDRIVQILNENVSAHAVEQAYINGYDGDMPTLILRSENWLSSAITLKNHAELKLDYLRNLTGVDHETHLEVVYHIVSLTTKRDYCVKIKTDREQPSIPSVSKVWSTANWNEREVFDLFGIDFPGHPNMTRIMMPDDWVGHPLRKDYEPLDPEV